MKRTSFYYVRPLNSCAHNQHYDCKITFPCMLSIFIPASAKIAVDDELIRFCDNYEQSMELTPYMLMMQERPDAFFAINDDTAMGILHTCKRYGYRIPDDISICGFTNSNITLACDPQLTTVEQRGYELGVAAARTLIERIENGTTEIKNSVVKTRLVVRGSTRPLPEHIVR